MGDSAGGGLAASVALLARDRALAHPPGLERLALVYPMLDERLGARTAKKTRRGSRLASFATLSADTAAVCWDAYLADATRRGSKEQRDRYRKTGGSERHGGEFKG
ncbi:hypothetical protein GGR56DRAFT_661701 [Xylariaceae sp. FL0804]|nr:hypothetical protein GGR56DRAFT_661701 [Xylariaceae sp. FL0804]